MVTPSTPLTWARRPRIKALNSLGVVYPTVSGTFRVVAPLAGGGGGKRGGVTSVSRHTSG
jgi:hypothetical protein